MGPKSATIPIYAAECAPANVRGALVMMWQIFTAFGIMCGYMAGVIFQQTLGLHDYPNGQDPRDENYGCYPFSMDGENKEFSPDLSKSWTCVSSADS